MNKTAMATFVELGIRLSRDAQSSEISEVLYKLLTECGYSLKDIEEIIWGIRIELGQLHDPKTTHCSLAFGEYPPEL